MWKYVTTPIYYANARPHIGHLYTTVYADAYSRWHRSRGSEVLFTTGMDEHGLKIQQQSALLGLSPQEFCDKTAVLFKDLFSRMHIDYTRFYRTTEGKAQTVAHREAVWSLWRRLDEAGCIYKDMHEGWYCSTEERFVQKHQVMPGKKEGTFMTKEKYLVEWVQEENYFFRIEPLKPKIEAWLRSSALDAGLQEQSLRELHDCNPISISRPRTRVHWGVPVPGDENHTIHVWLDALTSYVAALGFPDLDMATNPFWKSSFHVLGMEISRFHSVHLPAFLIAAGIPPSSKVKVHCHWLNCSVKMSKSLNNAVDPEVLIKVAGADALRFYLLYHGPQNLSNSEFTFADFAKVVTLLGGRLGNLLSRLTSPSVVRTSVGSSVELKAPEVYTLEEQQMLQTVVDHLSKQSTGSVRMNVMKGVTSNKRW